MNFNDLDNFEADFEVEKPKNIHKIKMFGTHNDTDNWVIAADSFFGFFDTREEAESVYNMVGTIDDSNIGSIQIIPPRHVVKFFDGSEPKGGFDKISDYKAVDIKSYIKFEQSKMY